MPELFEIIEEIDRARREDGQLIGFTEAKETVEINKVVEDFHRTLEEISYE